MTDAGEGGADDRPDGAAHGGSADGSGSGGSGGDGESVHDGEGANDGEPALDGDVPLDGETVVDGDASLDDLIAAEQPDPGGASAWQIGPRRIRRVGLLAVGCLVAGIGLAIGYGQPPLTALFRGSVLGALAFLLLTAALFVYWSIRQTMAR